MSVSIITFADLGDRKNLKTEDILPVIEKFDQENVLDQIICRRNNGFSFRNTTSAIPKMAFYLVKLLGKLLPSIFSSRRFEEKFFDYYASRLLKKTDICFFHGGYFLPRTFRKAKEQGIIVVDIPVTAHFKKNSELEEEELRILGITSYIPLYRKLYERSLHANMVDYVVALSDFARKTYVESGFPAERIFVAYQDIDMERISINKKTDETFRVLYVAHTSPLKGLHYLLEAWSELQLPNAELVLVGGYSEVMPHELQIRYQKLISNNSSIVWVGCTVNPQQYYNQASIFVLPSLTEGNPRVIMEAMAYGLPVITTEHAQSIVQDNVDGFVIPVRSKESLKEKITHFYRNKQLIQVMGAAAQNTIRHKESFAEKVFSFYKVIIYEKK